MIVPDINLLLYAYAFGSPFHAKAAQWWGDCLSGTEAVGLPHVVTFGFVRISTNPRVFDNPMTVGEAAAHVRSWLGQPCVELLVPSVNHTERVLDMLEELGTAGNLVSDAQIAVFAIENNAVVHTTDTDFARFPGLSWMNPLTGVQNRNE